MEVNIDTRKEKKQDEGREALDHVRLTQLINLGYSEKAKKAGSSKYCYCSIIVYR